jgi:hypothetical protein
MQINKREFSLELFCHCCLTLTLLSLLAVRAGLAAGEVPQNGKADDQHIVQRERVLADTNTLANAQKILSDIGKQPCSDKTSLVAKLIKVSRRKYNDAEVSTRFVDAIRVGLVAYPQSLLTLLSNNKYEVHLAPLVTICVPALKGKHPTGYAKEATYDTAGALFARKRKWIIVGEYSYRGKSLIPTPEFDHTVQHEVGHALDRLLGYPSHSSEFMECFNIDSKLMPAKRKQYLLYFLQRGSSGPQETFAELVASKYGDPLNQRAFHLPAAFPKCSALLDQLLPARESEVNNAE